MAFYLITINLVLVRDIYLFQLVDITGRLPNRESLQQKPAQLAAELNMDSARGWKNVSL